MILHQRYSFNIPALRLLERNNSPFKLLFALLRDLCATQNYQAHKFRLHGFHATWLPMNSILTIDDGFDLAIFSLQAVLCDMSHSSQVHLQKYDA